MGHIPSEWGIRWSRVDWDRVHCRCGMETRWATEGEGVDGMDREGKAGGAQGTAAPAAGGDARASEDPPAAGEPADGADGCCGVADTVPAECGCRYKNTERSDEFQANLQTRLNRVIGQLGGVKQMIDDNRYCGDVLTQLSAAESAIHKISEMVLYNHMQTCVVEQIREGNDEVVDELMQLVHRFG